MGLLVYFSSCFLTSPNCFAQDTIKPKCSPYLAVTGGLSLPLFGGYGKNYYNPTTSDYQYSGYASDGTAFSATAGVTFRSGWELAGMFSYMRNKIDANGYVNENDALFFGSSLQNYSFNTIGTYYYTNYGWLVGIGNNIGNNYVSTGISLMAGELITQQPAILENVNNAYHINLSSETHADFVAELGLHLDIKLAGNLFLRGMVDCLFSRLTTGGAYQYLKVPTGDVLYSGTYGGTNSYPTSFNVEILNTTIGLGYKF